MQVVILLVFVSLSLVICAVAFFVWTVRAGTLDHADRLALLPLADDLARVPHQAAPDVPSEEGS